jgi:hypothetical protein
MLGTTLTLAFYSSIFPVPSYFSPRDIDYNQVAWANTVSASLFARRSLFVRLHTQLPTRNVAAHALPHSLAVDKRNSKRGQQRVSEKRGPHHFLKNTQTEKELLNLENTDYKASDGIYQLRKKKINVCEVARCSAAMLCSGCWGCQGSVDLLKCSRSLM